MKSDLNYQDIQTKTERYIEQLKAGNFNLATIKAQIEREYGRR
jgi:hypothetical protein